MVPSLLHPVGTLVPDALALPSLATAQSPRTTYGLTRLNESTCLASLFVSVFVLFRKWSFCNGLTENARIVFFVCVFVCIVPGNLVVAGLVKVIRVYINCLSEVPQRSLK